MTLYIEGHSDDTVAWSEDPSFRSKSDSLDDCASVMDFVFTIGNQQTGGVRVIFAFARGDSPGWGATIELLEEDVPIPWPIAIVAQGYSVQVQITGASMADVVCAEKREPRP